MHGLQEPIRRDLFTESFGLCFPVDRASNRGELNSQTNVIDEAGDLLRRFTPRNLAADYLLEFRGVDPKGHGLDLGGRLFPAANKIDGIMGGNFLIAEA